MAQSSFARRKSLHGQWSSRLAFVLAVSGSAVGLGNIWRFPYVVGTNGGGAFVLVYLACVFVVGLPLMMSEILIGRRGRRNPVATMQLLGEEEAGTRHWRLVGGGGVVAAFFILSFYSVIAGWAVAYVLKSASGAFSGAGAQEVGAVFDGLTGSWMSTALWHTVFMAATVIVVARGVERGLEQAVRVLMPALIGLLVLLLGYSIVEGDFASGLAFMFEPKVEELTGAGVLAALGQAFFSLSVGMGAVMAYGAYLADEASIIRTSVAVVLADTSIAILAGLVIFPIVFANGLDPAAGPGLVFQSLPLAFGQMPGGVVIATIFFLLLTFAAWTSGISLLEPPVAFFMESRNLTRPAAASLVGGIIWVLGFLSVFSFNLLSEFTFFRGTFFDNLDFLTSSVILPIGGLAIVVFAGWVMSQNSTSDELDSDAGPAYRMWRFAARYIAPVAVLLIFLNAIGVI